MNCSVDGRPILVLVDFDGRGDYVIEFEHLFDHDSMLV
jgi:hypothetical protein